VSIVPGIGFTLAHELLHWAARPASARRHATLGIYAQRAAAFIHSRGQVSRRRSLLSLTLPFLALSIAPLLAAPALGHLAKEWSFVALRNAFASCVDLMLATAILREVPEDAMLIWGRPQIYWDPELDARR